jgi:hypothetical protein
MQRVRSVDLHRRSHGRGHLHQPLVARERGIKPRSREAFLSWAGGIGQQMVEKAELVGCGAYVGAEG